ncbi:MAG TPA: hypothetical protein VFT95_03210 [Micromonosporaceae bacterium]|nr:hypothetical protein [Micromonosporaceae bacterium]
MDATNTARRPDGSAVGMGLAMLVIVVLAVVFFPITLVVIFIVRSQEWAPRIVRAVARRLPKRGLR